MANRIVWFDVPASDLERAMTFYSKVLDVEINEEFPGVAVMSHDQGEGGVVSSRAKRFSRPIRVRCFISMLTVGWTQLSLRSRNAVGQSRNRHIQLVTSAIGLS